MLREKPNLYDTEDEANTEAVDDPVEPKSEDAPSWVSLVLQYLKRIPSHLLAQGNILVMADHPRGKWLNRSTINHLCISGKFDETCFSHLEFLRDRCGDIPTKFVHEYDRFVQEHNLPCKDNPSQHCEAYLLSLWLLALEWRRVTNPDSRRKLLCTETYEVGESVIRCFSRFLSKTVVLAASKSCCPSCDILVRMIQEDHEHNGKPKFANLGSHHVWYCTALPLALPSEYQRTTLAKVRRFRAWESFITERNNPRSTNLEVLLDHDLDSALLY